MFDGISRGGAFTKKTIRCINRVCNKTWHVWMYVSLMNLSDGFRKHSYERCVRWYIERVCMHRMCSNRGVLTGVFTRCVVTGYMCMCVSLTNLSDGFRQHGFDSL